MKCSTKGCRNEHMLIFLGKALCEKCWQKHCRDEEKRFEGGKDG